MSAFAQIQLQPAYGPGQLIVSWRLNAGYQDGLIFIYQSINGGLPPWELRNELGIPATAGYFTDEISNAKSSTLAQIHYRMALRMPDGTIHDSPVINPFSRLTPKEHRIVIDLMWQELRNMRGGNGVPVFIFAPLLSGNPSGGYDPLTSQMHSTGADSKGMPYQGGFGKPAITWMHRFGSMQTRQGPAKDGFGNTVGQASNARLLAFPRPGPKFMVVQPDADERFEIGEVITPLMFRGIIPIGYEVALLPIPRSDHRYDMATPPVPDEMYATAL